MRLAQIQKNEPSRKLGWGTVRNHIMEPFDDRTKRPIKKDPNLTGQNLQDWFDGGSVLGNDRFRFVNAYIVAKECEGLFDEYRDLIRDGREKYFHEALHRLYAGRRPVSINAEIFDNIPKLYISRPQIRSHFIHAFIYRVNVSSDVERIVIGYSRRSSPSLDAKGIKSAVLYEGFLIPQLIEDLTRNAIRRIRVHANLKFHRPAYLGDPRRGYADGQLEIETLIDASGAKTAKARMMAPPLSVDPYLLQELPANPQKRKFGSHDLMLTALRANDVQDSEIRENFPIIMEMDGEYYRDSELSYVIKNTSKGYLL